MDMKTVALIAGHNAEENAATFGYKLRTGGVTADAFPTSEQIARALVPAATDCTGVSLWSWALGSVL